MSICTGYYQEVVNGLLAPSLELHKALEILEEFQGEVLNDLVLKTVCFEQKDIFILCFQLIYDFLSIKPENFSFKEDKESRIIFPEGIAKISTKEIEQSYELGQYLQSLVVRRLKLISVVLDTLCAIFFRSEMVKVRSSILSSNRYKIS